MRFGWCVSGQGMAARALIAAERAALIRTRIDLIVTDRACSIETFCADHGIAHVRAGVPNLSACLIEARTQHGLDWLGLTFNRLLKHDVIEAYEGRILNMHLSLLPDFPGFNPTAKALAAGVETAGVSLHLIDAGIDTGPLVAQASCAVSSGDTVATLGRRQFEIAVPLLLQTIREIERGHLDVIGNAPIWTTSSHRPAVVPAGLRIDDDLNTFAADYCAALGR